MKIPTLPTAVLVLLSFAIALHATADIAPTSLAIPGTNIAKLLPDPTRPRIYAINQNAKNAGSVLVIDAITRALVKSIPVGNEPTDMDLTENASELLVINTTSKSISRINLETLAVTQTHQLAAFSNNNNDFGAHVEDGPGSIVYYVDEQWGPRLRVFNTATGTVLQTFSAESSNSNNTSNDYGFGDIVASPDGTKLFGWRQYGDGAGVLGTHIVRFNIQSDGTLANFTKSASYRFSNFDREPFDTPAMMTDDGSRLIVKDRVIDPANLDAHLEVYPDEIYSISPKGEIVCGANAIYPGGGGDILHDFPKPIPVQVITPDYSSLVYFDSSTKTIRWLDLIETLGTAALGLEIVPANGAVVLSPPELKWLPVTGITEYEVYFGTSMTAVTNATRTSPEFLGSSSQPSISLPANLTLGATYYWRAVPAGTNGGTLRSFTISNLSLTRASFDIRTLTGISTTHDAIDLSASTPVSWTAAGDAAWLTLDQNSGITPSTLGINIDTRTLSPGNHTARISVISAGNTIQIPVSVRVDAANFVIAEADLSEPSVWLISQESTTSASPSYLVRLDTRTDQFTSAVDCGRGVTDLAIHYKENRLYLTNHISGILRAFDRETLAQVQTYQFPPKGATGYSSGDVFRVFAGIQGRIIVSGYDQWVDAKLVNTVTGLTIDTAGVRAGDGIFDPSGRYYYHIDISSLKRFDTSANNLDVLTSVNVGSGSTISIAGDGSTLARGGTLITPDLEPVLTLPLSSGYPQYETIRALTFRGELAVTDSRIFNARNGLQLATLPVSSSIAAISGDQKKIYQFQPNTLAPAITNLAGTVDLPARGIIPSISNGSNVIGTDQTLGWTTEPFALSYDVYFGTDRDAVANATPGSPGHLGNVSANSWSEALPLDLGGDYYWRVDIRGFNGTQTGDVWAFSIAPIDINPHEIAIALPQHSPIPTQTITLSAPTPTPWTTSTATPWITLDSSSGNTDTPFSFNLDSSGLAVGIHQGAITFTSGSDTWDLPVTLDLIALNVTVMKPDPSRPGTLYAINHADPADHFSHLLRIEAASGRITDAIEVGRNATDFAVDPTTGLLYVANFNFPVTQVVDLDSFTVQAPITLDANIERIALDGKSRLFASSVTGYNNVVAWNLNTLKRSSLGVSLSYGTTEIDPTGSFLYHAQNYSQPKLSKVDLTTNPETLAAQSAQVTTTRVPLILSVDGSRAILDQSVFDADCRLLSVLPATARCISPGAELAAGSNAVWWTDGGAEVFPLPFTASTSAFAADSSYLVLFNPAGSSLHSVPVASFADLPGPWPRPGQSLSESPKTITWSPVAGAASYTLTISGGPSGNLVFDNIPNPSFTLPAKLPFGWKFTWRVDAITLQGTIAGTNQGFAILFPEGPAIDGLGTFNAGGPVALGSTSLIFGGDGAAYYHTFDPATGTSSPSRTFSIDGASYLHDFGAPVAVSSSGAYVSAPEYDTSVSNIGAIFSFQPDSRGFLQISPPITASSPASSERFGSGLAASGDLMLAGTNGGTLQGRVFAYLTQPDTIQTQILKPSDPENYDGFGSQIALHGNTALIAASRSGTSSRRVPNAYVFTRNPSTGLWNQFQKLSLPGAATYESVGTSIALSDELLAINNATDNQVLVFSLNGTWTHSATISQSDVPGSTSLFGDSVTLSGDQLFIGDPGALIMGTGSGAVFTFRRNGNSWLQGPTISPTDLTRSNFGRALDAGEGWLLVGGSSNAWIFPIDPAPNHSPRFTSPVPAQAVSGRRLDVAVTADDLDGNDGLAITALQLPAWLSLTDSGNGDATLSGTPNSPSGSTFDVQLQVADSQGATTLRTFRLTLLSESDVPRIVTHPIGEELSAGQELILRGSVQGIGPFHWQWFQDGVEIPGANGATLNLAEVGLDDAGSYAFTVSNAVSSVTSEPATIHVRPANRFAGPWPTFGGNTRHSGTHPAALGRHTFIPAWETSVFSLNGTTQRPAIAGGRVFVTPYVYFGGNQNAVALDLKNGETLWTHAFANAFSINPPSYHNGRVYIQRGNHSSDTHLWCLDAESGATIWSSPHSAQWERYEAPTVTDDGIWVNGGSYGGMYGFAPDGTQRFFRSMSQVSGWTPAVSAGRLFTSLGNSFIEHNPADGTTLWSVTTQGSATSIPVISGNRAVVSKAGGLACIDLDERLVLWQFSGNEGSRPAVADGVVYSIYNNFVSTYALETGAPGRVFTTPSSSIITSEQALVLNDHLLVANNTQTFVFSLATGGLVQTLQGGGKLAYSDGYLIIAGNDSKLRAYFANAAPEFAATMPPLIDVPDAAGDILMPLAPYASDPDPADSLAWAVVSISNPNIFRTLALDPTTGDLTVIYNPWQSGSSDVVLSITDPVGNVTETTLTFVVPAHPVPQLDVSSSITLNRQTGLYEHSIRITNSGAREIAGFDLTITGLPEGVCVNNGSDCIGGTTTVHHRQALAAGASVTLMLEYYAPARGTVLDPRVSAALVTEPDIDATASAAGLAVDQCMRQTDGSLLIEFTSIPGALYEVQYSEDAVTWKVSPVRVRAAGNRVQWIDRGPPRTDSPPSQTPCRFYRVLRITEPD